MGIEKAASIAEIVSAAAVVVSLLFTKTARRLIYPHQNVHHQHREGVVDDDLWQPSLASLDEHLAGPGSREIPAASRPHLRESFNELLSSRTPEDQ